MFLETDFSAYSPLHHLELPSDFYLLIFGVVFSSDYRDFILDIFFMPLFGGSGWLSPSHLLPYLLLLLSSWPSVGSPKHLPNHKNMAVEIAVHLGFSAVF